MLPRTIAALSLLATACAADIGGPDHEPSGSLTDRLSAPVAVSIAPSGSAARVRAVSLRDGSPTDVELAIVGGTLTLAASDGQLRVDRLEVGAADITVGASVIPPDGVRLTGIALDLSTPASGALAMLSDSAGSVAAVWDVQLRWAVELEHGVVDLAPIRLPAMSFEMSLALDDDGAVDAHLTAAEPGSFWSWAGIFALSQLELDLVGSTSGDVE
jgi:hypothetical protein